MSSVDQFFNDEIKAIATQGKAIARSAAEELYEDVRRQIRANFRNPSNAFLQGLKIYEFDEATYVRLSPILSTHARPTSLEGSPNIQSAFGWEASHPKRDVWILLPDGARLGFKRMGRGFDWNTLRRRYGTRLSFVRVRDGHVVLYRDMGRTFPIYKIQSAVTTKQRIEFYEKADEIADRYSLETENDPEKSEGRGIGFKR